MPIAGKLTTRQTLIATVVALLFALNLWRWWPASVVVENDIDRPATDVVRIDEMKLAKFIKQTSKYAKVERNLFSPVVAQIKHSKPVISKNKIVKTVAPKIDNNEQYAGLNAFKLEGVLDNGGKMQAFLSNKEQVYLVYKGKEFASRFIVERITLEGILLRDKTKNLSKWIELGGE